MKALKIIGLVIVIVVAVLFAGMSIQSDVHVDRSVEINASKDVIVKQLVDFKNFNEWSPWTDYDPNCKYEFEGETGMVGSKYSWSGNDQVGVGYMEITNISDSRIDNKLVFTSPWESESVAYYEFSEGENGVKVTWGYDGKSPMLMNLFMSMDDMLGPDYEKGLDRLKERCES